MCSSFRYPEFCFWSSPLPLSSALTFSSVFLKDPGNSLDLFGPRAVEDSPRCTFRANWAAFVLLNALPSPFRRTTVFPEVCCEPKPGLFPHVSGQLPLAASPPLPFFPVYAVPLPARAVSTPRFEELCFYGSFFRRCSLPSL